MAIDWPGFGAQAKVPVDWRPAAYRAFLDFAVDEIAPGAELVVAAGHAAGYLLDHASGCQAAGRRLVLVAPTWRGPLPTVLGRRPGWLGHLARMADVPILGGWLHRLNVNPAMVRMMARAHVYSDPGWLDPGRAAAKRAVTRAQGARHAAVRFVAGELDPFRDRAGFLAAAAALRDHALVIYGEDTPPRSKGEMEALAALPGIASVVLPRGKLSVHEEFPEAVTEAILRFARTTE